MKDDETTYSRKVISHDALSHALNVGIKGDRLRVKLSSYAANEIIERSRSRVPLYDRIFHSRRAFSSTPPSILFLDESLLPSRQAPLISYVRFKNG